MGVCRHPGRDGARPVVVTAFGRDTEWEGKAGLVKVSGSSGGIVRPPDIVDDAGLARLPSERLPGALA